MKKFLIFTLAVFGSSLILISQSQASVFITEILADPAAGAAGDSNQDGTRSTTQDEFIEFFNSGDEDVDLSGWFVSDSVRTRHIFPENTVILPRQYLLVFAGGSPTLTNVDWQLASEGSLGLNNSGDIVTLHNVDGDNINEVVYDSIGNHNQSIIRAMETPSANFILHTQLESSNGELFSPGVGFSTNIQDMSESTITTPEPQTVSGVLVGFLVMFISKGRINFS